MRQRPPREVRIATRNNNDLADMVLRGDLDAARQQAARIKEQARTAEERARAYCRSIGRPYGKP